MSVKKKKKVCKKNDIVHSKKLLFIVEKHVRKWVQVHAEIENYNSMIPLIKQPATQQMNWKSMYVH